MESEEWSVVETTEFQAAIVYHLTEFELRALRNQLAREPFAGEPVPGAEPILRLQLGKTKPVSVLYVVIETRNVIHLIDVGVSGEPIEIDPEIKKKLSPLLDFLKRVGASAVGKAVWDLIKEWWKNGADL